MSYVLRLTYAKYLALYKYLSNPRTLSEQGKYGRARMDEILGKVVPACLGNPAMIVRVCQNLDTAIKILRDSRGARKITTDAIVSCAVGLTRTSDVAMEWAEEEEGGKCCGPQHFVKLVPVETASKLL